MLKVKMIAVGQPKEAWLLAALAEYEKRFKGRLSIEWIFAEDDRHLFALCLKEPLLIALDLKGELVNSEAFAAKWDRLGSRVACAIGGPEGLPREVLEKANWRWCLSPLTFTNQITRLIAVEQIYRALEIGRGSPYHK